MDRGEALVVPQRFQRRKTGMQAEVSIEIDDRVLGNGDARALLVVQRVTVRDDHVQAIDRTALEKANENRAVEDRSEEHTSELQSLAYLVCRLLLENKNMKLSCPSST